MGGSVFMVPLFKNCHGVRRALLCFFLFLGVSIILRLPVTEGMKIFSDRMLLFSTAVLFVLWQCVLGNTKRFYSSFAVFTLFYTSMAYIPLLEGMKLTAGEVNDAMCMGAMLFCILSLLYYVVDLVDHSVFRWILVIVAAISTVICLLPPLIMWGYYFISGHLLTADIILTLFQTNVSEVRAYLQGQSIVLWGGALVACISIIIGITMELRRMKSGYPDKKMVVVVIVLTVCLSAMATHKMTQAYCVSMIKTTYQTLHSFKEYGTVKEQRQQKLNEMPNLKIASHAGGIYVLVIGESETRDHMHIYGYDRDDTPWLDTFVTESGSIQFSHAYSNHTHTVPVLTYALSEKNQYNSKELVNAYSIMEIAKSAGYTTYWISNQQKYGAWDTPIAEIASTADVEIWMNGNVGEQTKTLYNDGKLIDEIPDLSNVKNGFIIIHLMGCHGAYQDRYPKEYKHFSGNDKDIDQYDNSILYNDAVLHQLYETVKTNPRFRGWIYMPDHGEDVDHHKGHEATKFTDTMSHIPLIMHFSPSFINNRADTFQQLQNHKECYWTNDLLYDVLIDILGIQGVPDADPTVDLASPYYDRNQYTLRTLHGCKVLDAANE
jgi:heptose-I-phosphate ethanolaminephosphotransferase